MTNLANINITHEFRQVCDIFNLRPEQIIQDFIDNVSIADYLCDPYSLNRWANTFVFECVIAQVESEEIMTKYDKFAERLIKTVLANPKDTKDLAQKMVDEWHKAVLEDRIEDVINGDDN